LEIGFGCGVESGVGGAGLKPDGSDGVQAETLEDSGDEWVVPLEVSGFPDELNAGALVC
jgi:hypothetical protein